MKPYKYLIEEKGVNPNFADENGWTLLHIAAEHGNFELNICWKKEPISMLQLNMVVLYCT